MSSNLIVYLIAALTTIICAVLMFGLPTVAILGVRFFKYKERELTLELEARQKSQHQLLALDQRVQSLEDALSSLDHDVRVRLGIDHHATPLSSRPDLLQGHAATDSDPVSPSDPSRSKSR